MLQKLPSIPMSGAPAGVTSDPRDAEIARLRTRVRELEQGLAPDPLMLSIAENSPDYIMLLDASGHIQYINRTIPNVTREQVMGLTVFDFVAPEFHEDIRRTLAQVEATRQPGGYASGYTAPSGETTWWEARVGAMTRDDAFLGFAVIATNVTEQRRATEDRERFFNLSVDSLSVTSCNGYFKRVNPAFVATLGYSAEEIAGQHFATFVHPEDIEQTREAVGRLRRGEPLIDFETRYRRSDGQYRLLSWRAVSDAHHRMVYAVARDVTDTKLLEEQLRHSQKMDAIGQLAGGVAHDFNNLLHAIQGNLHFSLRARTPEEARDFVSEAMRSTHRAADLTRQLLAFGRRQPMSASPICLNMLVSDLMKLLRRLIPAHIEIELVTRASLPGIVGDRVQLEQVIVNLCVNARDAMPGGGRLTLVTDTNIVHEDFVKRSPGTRPARYVTLTVTDTGIGMDAELRQHVFEPFFTTKEPGRGTGLGLATAYGIVKQHDGLVRVESTPGKGSTFAVYLPASETVAAPARVASPLVAPGGHERILVAEDDAVVRDVIVRSLADAGYDVVVATDGLEAVHLFDRDAATVPLVVLDVTMPKLNGPDAAARMRAVRPGVKVLLTSGYTDASVSRAAGHERLLCKPFLPEQLLQQVRDLLDGRS
jgi:PAS domain S-box-containing protein